MGGKLYLKLVWKVQFLLQPRIVMGQVGFVMRHFKKIMWKMSHVSAPDTSLGNSISCKLVYVYNQNAPSELWKMTPRLFDGHRSIWLGLNEVCWNLT